MEIKYLDQINAFAVKSAGVLGPGEQAVYMRLLFIWNGLRRPEGWFSVANSQLMKEAGIKRVETLKPLRNTLAEKGFIEWNKPSKGLVNQYKIIPLGSTNNVLEVVQNTVPTSTNNVVPLVHKIDYPSTEKCTGVVHGSVVTSTKNRHIKERDIKENNKENLKESISSAYREDDDFDFVRQAYENNIKPITSLVEMQKLQDDCEHYGHEKVIEAIQTSINKKIYSLAYIEGILRRQEQQEKETERKKNEPYRGPYDCPETPPDELQKISDRIYADFLRNKNGG